MENLEETLISWAQKEFRTRLNPREVNSLLTGKHGPNLSKCFQLLSQQIKSQKTGKRMRLFCEALTYSNELEEMEKEVDLLAESMDLLKATLEAEEAKMSHKNSKYLETKRREGHLKALTNLLEAIAASSQQKVPFDEVYKNLNSVLTEADFTVGDAFRPVLEAGDGLNNRTISIRIPYDKLVEETEHLVAEINGLLYEIQKKSPEDASEILNETSLTRLINHNCYVMTAGNANVNNASNSVEEVLDKELEGSVNRLLAKYNEQQKPQWIKITGKLSKAKSMLENTLAKTA